MNKVILVLSFILFPFLLLAQQSTVPPVGSQWTEMDYSIVNFSDPVIYQVESDTTINDQQYRKIGPGYFRDSEDVWYVWSEEDNQEYMYFDFTASVGDTLHPFNPFVDEVVPYMVVSAIDSLQLMDGNWYQTISVFYEDDIFISDATWIEDLGSLSGIMENAKLHNIDAGYTDLVCFSLPDGTLLYEEPVPDQNANQQEVIYENCYWYTGLNEIESETVSVYPNPFRNELKLQGKASLDHQVVIYESTGRKVLRVQKKGIGTFSIDTSSLPSGAYYIQVDGQERSVFIKTK